MSDTLFKSLLTWIIQAEPSITDFNNFGLPADERSLFDRLTYVSCDRVRLNRRGEDTLLGMMG